MQPRRREIHLTHREIQERNLAFEERKYMYIQGRLRSSSISKFNAQADIDFDFYQKMFLVHFRKIADVKTNVLYLSQ